MAKLANITATGQVLTPNDSYHGPAKIYGIHVNSHSSGTLKLQDSPGGASGRFVFGSNNNAFSFPAGSGIYRFSEPLDIAQGVYATVGGTLDCDLIYDFLY